MFIETDKYLGIYHSSQHLKSFGNSVCEWVENYTDKGGSMCLNFIEDFARGNTEQKKHNFFKISIRWDYYSYNCQILLSEFFCVSI